MNNGLVKVEPIRYNRFIRIFRSSGLMREKWDRKTGDSTYGQISIRNAIATNEHVYMPIASFNADRGIWFVYDGQVWQPDENALAVAELAKTIADHLYVFAFQIKDEDTRNRYIKRMQKLQLRKNRKTMIEDAKSVYPVRMDANKVRKWSSRAERKQFLHYTVL